MLKIAKSKKERFLDAGRYSQARDRAVKINIERYGSKNGALNSLKKTTSQQYKILKKRDT